MKVLTDLQQIAVQLVQGKPVEFSGVSGDQAIRNALLEAMGGEFSPYTYNTPTVFALMAELVDATTGTLITNQFDALAEVRNTTLGDKPVFNVEDTKLFRVARIAGGKNDVRRQRVTSGSFTVDTGWYTVATYTEFEQFMAKRVDFAKWIKKIATSFANDMGTQIYKSVLSAYPALTAPRKATGAYDGEVLATLVDHVEALSGKKAVIYGSRKAIRKINRDNSAGLLSENMKDTINKVGFIDTFEGTPIFLLPNAYEAGTTNFVAKDDVLLVIPEGDKIVKVLLEGEAVVVEKSGVGDRTDMQIEHQVLKKMGIGVSQASVYGAYSITA